MAASTLPAFAATEVGILGRMTVEQSPGARAVRKSVLASRGSYPARPAHSTLDEPAGGAQDQRGT